jgi:hypothetical protein
MTDKSDAMAIDGAEGEKKVILGGGAAAPQTSW